jgi:large subunit ribosomal protein L35Ae
MEAHITAFRGTFRRKSPNHMIIISDSITTREKAEKMIGKSVAWVAPGKNKTKITGKIAAAHGKKGAMRAIFERGMPGQSLGATVKIE